MLGKITEALSSWEGICSHAKDRSRWRIVPASIWWTIWKERNSRCFESLENDVQKIKLNFILLLCFWCNQIYSNDTGSDFSPSVGSDTLCLTWDCYNHDIHQAIYTPAVFGVNSSGFEHEILDMILRMEQKRQSQKQQQKGRSSEAKKSKKGRNRGKEI
ncbi:hypothetical protein H5410_028489, partial [Solanum commersonii]